MLNSENHADPLLQRVESQVRKLYRGQDEMPFHNAQHPFDVRENVRRLVQVCKASGVSVDESVVEIGALIHDAYSDVDFKLLGFSSAEELAAAVTYNLVISEGGDVQTAEKAANSVRATNPHVKPSSIEEKILRAADLMGLSSTYSEFKNGSDNLRREASLKKGSEISAADYTVGQCKHLQLYLWRMIELTPNALDAEGRSVWHTLAMSNILKLIEETEEQRGVRVKVVLCEVGEDGSIIHPQIDSTESICLLAFSHDEDLREIAVKICERCNLNLALTRAMVSFCLALAHHYRCQMKV